MHLDAGQQVWLVTATPYELAATIARRLGLTGALGTVAESVDGVFTGRLVGDILHGLGKAHAVRSLAIREGLNLRRCTAYSDSFNDVPMLSLVGTAVAINPDAALRDLARERGWEIRDFRTARKAARIGVPSALALGAAGGALAAVASRRQLALAPAPAGRRHTDIWAIEAGPPPLTSHPIGRINADGSPAMGIAERHHRNPLPVSGLLRGRPREGPRVRHCGPGSTPGTFLAKKRPPSAVPMRRRVADVHRGRRPAVQLEIFNQFDVPINMERVLHRDQKLIFHRPILAGDKLSSTPTWTRSSSRTAP